MKPSGRVGLVWFAMVVIGGGVGLSRVADGLPWQVAAGYIAPVYLLIYIGLRLWRREQQHV